METNTRDAQIKSGVLVHLVDHFCYDDDDNDDGEVVDDNDNVVDDDGDEDDANDQCRHRPCVVGPAESIL